MINHLRQDFGVEPVCRELDLSASAYYARRTGAPSARTRRDGWLVEQIRRVHSENYGVHGARRIWHAPHREGIGVARTSVERLMRTHQIEGVIRGRRRRTTLVEPAAARPADLVNRQFTASRPNALWVADLTYVHTFGGWVYVAFVRRVLPDDRRLAGRRPPAYRPALGRTRDRAVAAQA